MKVILANKFFFLNGGSETVFFQERAFLLATGVGVVDFSMQDERNFPSPYTDAFVGPRSYRQGAGGAWSKIASAWSLIHSSEAVKRIAALIERANPDILHCHNVYHQLTPSIMRTAKRMGVKVVLTLHDYKVICPTYTRLRNGEVCDACQNGDFFNVVRYRCADGSLGKSGLLYAEALTQRAMGSYECVDRVITVCRFMLDAVTRWRFPKERVSLLYNGVDLARFPSAAAAEGNYILFIGRLSREKGLLTLGKAQVGTAIRVIVAGTGPLEPVLRRDYPGLELVGHQSGEALKSLISGAAAVVLPSECYENCPMALLEAMAAGRPTIGTRMGGIPELIADQETGVLFPAGDHRALRRCMQDLMSDAERQQKMGQLGRSRVEKCFSLTAHNDELLKIYESVL